MLYFVFMSIAISIDALGIGISYRLKGVTIPTITKIIIGIVTGGIMQGSICLGQLVNKGLEVKTAKYIGAFVLIGIGIIFMYNSIFKDEEAAYDFNHSRKIEPIEGAFLAIALSVDSIGAGIAIATSGLSCWYLGIMSGVTQFFLLVLADYLVKHIKVIQNISNKICGVLAGILLVLIGVLRCFAR